ncbi:conserved hypothetical protein [Pseudarthrobacter chlorophenolicus A6]|uniref:DUF4192 domain-containing protein n=1 Tax=Pseudarthrobacter chlorophenolicus (strain ATCC 700700 / DSM 12829 / CIP 107037 / JCM 12360 / KCTC 9906 / NCIMB 13794 / A6) TaxID=452863 RepID=B8HH09_PSECP|nr:DUF4192 domain-containing protein [Pseudarthrobacter chlorophenolicus]ACL39598.1 conserved hypothetical protein [Pseudarthrobacter chlorophenolicus A6]SDQ96767.1 protein of unknown function [Pseudarthrobacter chlorophenolicus]
MTAPERLTVTGPADILGFIPHSLGYWPSDSLVAMTMHGRQLGATLRLDLPAPEADAAPEHYLQAVRGYLDADTNADGTLLAVFTSDTHLAAGTYGRLLAGLAPVLDQAGMPVRDAWYVGGDYWRDAFCLDADCCPGPGRPVQEIRDSALNAEMVYRGSSVGPAPERRETAARPVSAMHRAAAMEAEEEWERGLAPRRRSLAQFRLVLDVWEDLLARPAALPWVPDVDRDGFLSASLLVPHWRDAVLVMSAAGRKAAEGGVEGLHFLDDALQLEAISPLAVSGNDTGTPGGPGGPGSSAGECWGLERLHAAYRAEPVPVDGEVPNYGAVLMGIAPAAPDWAGMDGLDRILAELAALNGQAAAAALTGRGWISWCRGRGSYAARYLRDAMTAQPGYRLAELILELVGRGSICGWAARKESAWQKFGPGAAA